ncbi:hypothetical protein [Corynebacterium lipophiloflavum]|uniref:Secreted protein n=1 Tax=Corynebacterium lipophiloflavum (strain ATCC 700352 / DSM 44291 / CCUG 37336 / JCM 10383 / DMMZ 1944) TaxID=525263 RepID=C0XTY0_CORLD|nr:hypothetical protein [Corynebacterium lipophiloflavum]EEI16314.1 hypothetical protein HMPREF0298_1900 [Corynebacterium lipophiloflavum DSM 44291]
MNRTAIFLGASALVLGATSCATEPTEPVIVSVTTTTTHTTTTTPASTSEQTETTEPTTTASAPAKASSKQREPAAAQNSAFTSPGEGYQCPGTDAFVTDPAYCTSTYLGGDPSYDENCPNYLCGYGVDANGNPNPTSGEIQTMDGCEQGYITDPSLCSAVAQRAEQYGW